MKNITADPKLVAFCGLYCGACGSFLRGKCPGCYKNDKATWCKVRNCCRENKYSTCADCKKVPDVADCKKHNNLIARIFSFIFRSNRQACIRRIKETGISSFAVEMAGKRAHSMK
jgi:hypothetical protein